MSTHSSAPWRLSGQRAVAERALDLAGVGRGRERRELRRRRRVTRSCVARSSVGERAVACRGSRRGRGTPRTRPRRRARPRRRPRRSASWTSAGSTPSPSPNRTDASSEAGADDVQTPPPMRPTVIPYGQLGDGSEDRVAWRLVRGGLERPQGGDRAGELVERPVTAADRPSGRPGPAPSSRAQTTPVPAWTMASPVGSPTSVASARWPARSTDHMPLPPHSSSITELKTRSPAALGAGLCHGLGREQVGREPALHVSGTAAPDRARRRSRRPRDRGSTVRRGRRARRRRGRSGAASVRRPCRAARRPPSCGRRRRASG